MKKLIFTLSVVFCCINLQAQCNANFSYMQNGPTTVFTDLSTINPSWSTNYSVTWEWDFGDGTPISTQQKPVHTYANNGIYSPCLTVVYFDSVIINTCVSVYCDSIWVGNGPTSSWDCAPTGCYDPGNGMGTYATLLSCQSACIINSSSLCDSIVVTGSQTQLSMQVNNFNSIIYYWITTSTDGTVLGEDSMWNMHNVYNSNPAGIPNDTIITCITYMDANGFVTCCIDFVWDATTGLWAKMGMQTTINEINNYKELIKVVDVLGKESMIDFNKILFFIYSDGTIEKKIYK